MDVVAAMMFLAVPIGGLVWLFVRKGQQRDEDVQARVIGQLQHRRSGDYPAACSWCRNTALARKLFVFERVDGAWRACDLLARMRQCADAEVEELASALVTDQPTWRRFCSERCTNDFFAASHLEVRDPFVTCAYCSVRSPNALVRCPHCDAPRTAGVA